MNSIIEKIHKTEENNDFITTEQELLNLIQRHKTKLFEAIDDKSADTLTKLLDCMEELYFIKSREEFESGFSMGGKIVSEIFYK